MDAIRTYSELVKLPTHKERFEYLRLNGVVGDLKFGYNRRLNQQFYLSKEWRDIRQTVILRDNGCDLGVPEYPIRGQIHIHHMNPLTIDDLKNSSDFLLNPEYLICVSDRTHNAITYGTAELLPKDLIERAPNDTCPWRK